MKKTMIFSVLFMLCCLGAMAQGFDAGKLKNGLWRLTKHHANEMRTLSFTDSIKHDTYWIFWKGKWSSSSHDHPYYLSNIIPQAFDFSKVGKGESGRYFVEWNDKLNEVLSLEIIYLSDSYLKFKNDCGDVLIYRKE